MKPLMTALLIFFSCGTATAQLEKIVHQTFDIGENKSISLNIAGEVTVIPWAGNTVMTETKIELYDASPSIFNHFLEVERRYEIQADTSANGIQLFSFDQERRDIRTKNGACPEIVQVKIFIPEEFEKKDEVTLVKAE